MPNPETEVARIASSQHAAFSVGQAEATGMTRKRVRRLLARGVYQRLAPEVLGVAGAPSTRRQAIMVAVLTVGDAAASHRTAAELWGLSPPSRSVDVVVKRWDRVYRPFAVH